MISNWSVWRWWMPGAIGSKRWLGVARWVCVALAGLAIVLFVMSLPLAFDQHRTICTAPSCPDDQLTQQAALRLAEQGISVDLYAALSVAVVILSMLGWSAIGAFILLRRSDDRMALIAGLMLVVAGVAFTNALNSLAERYPIWMAPVTAVNVAGQVSFFLFLYLFPDGRIPPGRMRWPTSIILAGAIVSELLDGFSLGTDAWPAWLTVLIPLIEFGTAVGVQIHRYRNISKPFQREQTKWIVFGVGSSLGGFLLLIVFGTFVLPDLGPLTDLIFNTVIGIILFLIPISIGVAILRHRLWDIDIIVNKTLVYGTVTLVLLGIYLALVLGLGAVLRSHSGESSDLVVAASTLAVAALIRPVRSRIQSTVDRRFYRHKYDATRTLEAFSARLRDEIDLDTLLAELGVVVQETMQPTQVSLWLSHDKAR